MAFAIWLRALSATIWPARSRGNGLFLDEKCFRFEMARERMRVDRNRSPLAVLTIELPIDRATPADFDFLGRTLIRRLRITDTIGCITDRKIGVLLPDTTAAGAWKVASDICSVYPVGHDRPNCEVFVYPEDQSSKREGAAQREPEPVASPTTAAVESLFAMPTPKWKRAIDVLGAFIGLVLSLPLLIVAGVAIKLSSRGPIFYSQLREGLGGRRFRIYKLRTMKLDAESQQLHLRVYSTQDGPAFKMPDDPRTTWVGRWLRATSLDEIPQFLNVLRGEMSLVGPRPLPVHESLQCTPWQRQRLHVLPGMTCIWQISGRSTVSFDEWMRMDLQYVRRRSLLHDLSLLLATGPSVIASRGPR
ncbi:MAG TPA: sugar transferase [Lacipirellulaceae bacterium]|nr:sugar transferase [Lacipirellulaceae bacterium]